MLTALMGVPYGVVSTASNQGLYVSARPEERGVAAGIFQTCRYLGAITATVLIGVLYGPGVNQANWGLMVLVLLGLGAVVLGLAVAWKRKGIKAWRDVLGVHACVRDNSAFSCRPPASSNICSAVPPRIPFPPVCTSLWPQKADNRPSC